MTFCITWERDAWSMTFCIMSHDAWCHHSWCACYCVLNTSMTFCITWRMTRDSDVVTAVAALTLSPVITSLGPRSQQIRWQIVIPVSKNSGKISTRIIFVRRESWALSHIETCPTSHTSHTVSDPPTWVIAQSTICLVSHVCHYRCGVGEMEAQSPLLKAVPWKCSELA